jgi:hypothetical protein
MKVFQTVIKQIAVTRWMRLRELQPSVRLLVWSMGLKERFQDFQSMSQRIAHLWRKSGPTFVIQYLKEATAMTVGFIARTPIRHGAVRVARSRAGLPLLIPAKLRSSFTAIRTSRGTLADWMVVRAVLTVLTLSRSMGARPILKLETITGPFSGVGQTLAQPEVENALERLHVKALNLKPASPWLVSESAGPNYPKATWGSALDALAFWYNPGVAWNWIRVAVAIDAYLLLAWLVLVMTFGLPVVLVWVIGGCKAPKLGQLRKLFEANGKVRVVAVTDWWTQALLKPLHDGLYGILRTIPMDGTFDQLGPIERLRGLRPQSTLHSFDLSAATDRLPVALQVQVLKALGFHASGAWALLLVGREWWLGPKPVRYAVGQPMGAYSSWAMLALTHHVVVQVAAARAGYIGTFPYYAVLGDDLVIADAQVAKNYQVLMSYLGVPINLSKSLVSERTLEFAKRWVHMDHGEFSPLGSGVLLGCVRSPRMLPMLIAELANKGYTFYPSVVKGLFSVARVNSLRRKIPQAPFLLSLLALGPSGGHWKGGQVSTFVQAWIASFHMDVPPVRALHIVHEALLRVAIHKVNRAVVKRKEALDQFFQNWAKFTILGDTLVRGTLSIPLMLIAPGAWAHLWALKAELSVSFRHGIPGPDGIDPEDLLRMSKEVLGDVSALRWSERTAVLNFLENQEQLLEAIREVKDLDSRDLDIARTSPTVYPVSTRRVEIRVTKVTD